MYLRKKNTNFVDGTHACIFMVMTKQTLQIWNTVQVRKSGKYRHYSVSVRSSALYLIAEELEMYEGTKLCHPPYHENYIQVPVY